MMTMGVDLGQKKAAFAIWEHSELLTTDAYVSDAISQPRQLLDVANWVSDAVEEIEPDYIFIEEPLVGNNKRYSLNLAKMYGAVLADLAMLEVDIIPVNVQQWKKNTVGNGNASKEQVRDWLNSLDSVYSSICGSDQDQIDAAAIGYYGAVLVLRADALSVSG